jgi:hypothetical protein
MNRIADCSGRLVNNRKTPPAYYQMLTIRQTRAMSDTTSARQTSCTVASSRPAADTGALRAAGAAESVLRMTERQ